jgi:hypothetical protein
VGILICCKNRTVYLDYSMKFATPRTLAIGFLLFGATIALGYQEGARLVAVAALGTQQSGATINSTIRSSLYPTNWFPGYTDAEGRYLQDFSYAGYRMGENIPSNPPGSTYNVTEAPYNADKTGVADSTEAIQKALDDAGTAGGGVVFLPAGIYKISVTDGKGLWLKRDKVVLRGAGTDKTFIYNNSYKMRGAKIIYIGPASPNRSMEKVAGSQTKITKNLIYPTKQIPVENVAGFAVGNWVTITFDFTNAFIADINMTDVWDVGDAAPVTFLRQVTAVDPTSNVITVDIPTRYPIKTRDNARIYVTATPLQEIGIEHFSIGNREHPSTAVNWKDTTLDPHTGKIEFDIDSTYLFDFNYVANSWIQDVDTYKPAVNKRDFEVASNALYLEPESRSITVSDVHVKRPQLVGQGGNGYGITLNGQESLVQRSSSSRMRHNFAFWRSYASGNVLTNNTANNSLLNSEYHGKLSPSNLIEKMKLVSEPLYAPYSTCCEPVHGIGSSMSVFWNITGQGKVLSDQLGWGYIIGTGADIEASAPHRSYPDMRPVDFLEAIGKASNLQPQSLYQDQLAKRLSGSTKPSCTLKATPSTSSPMEKVKLTWSSKNARACSGVGFDTDGAATSGTVVVAPNTTSTYRLTCSNFAEVASCETTATVQPVTIEPPKPPSPPIVEPRPGTSTIKGVEKLSCNFNATPSALKPGQNLTLNWSSTGATSCSGRSFSTASANGAPSGSVVIKASNSKTYGVVCKNGTQSVRCEADVLVTPPSTPGCSITATPSSVAPGEKVTITWKTNAPKGCGGKGFSTASTGYASSGSVVVTPTNLHTYGVECKDFFGSLTISCYVPVTIKK